MYPIIFNRLGRDNPSGSNKRFCLRFFISSGVRLETTEEGWRTHRPKFGEFNKDVQVSSLNILINNNYQASFQTLCQKLFTRLKLVLDVWRVLNIPDLQIRPRAQIQTYYQYLLYNYERTWKKEIVTFRLLVF